MKRHGTGKRLMSGGMESSDRTPRYPLDAHRKYLIDMWIVFLIPADLSNSRSGIFLGCLGFSHKHFIREKGPN